MRRASLGSILIATAVAGCPGGGGSGMDGGTDAPRRDGGPRPDAPAPPIEVVCDPGPTPSATVMAPTLMTSFSERWHEAWLASPAVADLDADGTNEIVIARAGRLQVWHPDGTLAWSL